MKTCTTCGRENGDQATKCRECGTEFVLAQSCEEFSPEVARAGERLEIIAVLDNEIQAGLIDAMLVDQEVPHIMQTYRDSAYGGIFQTQKGWGAVLGPSRFRNEILAVLEDIKGQTHPPPSGLEAENT